MPFRKYQLGNKKTILQRAIAFKISDPGICNFDMFLLSKKYKLK